MGHYEGGYTMMNEKELADRVRDLTLAITDLKKTFEGGRTHAVSTGDFQSHKIDALLELVQELLRDINK